MDHFSSFLEFNFIGLKDMNKHQNEFLKRSHFFLLQAKKQVEMHQEKIRKKNVFSCNIPYPHTHTLSNPTLELRNQPSFYLLLLLVPSFVLTMNQFVICLGKSQISGDICRHLERNKIGWLNVFFSMVFVHVSSFAFCF